MHTPEKTRLDVAMSALECTSVQLSRYCSISNSLISRWRNGTRRLTVQSDAALELARALTDLDCNHDLDTLLEPYLMEVHEREQAMWLYLVDPLLPPVPAPASQSPGLLEGEYVSQQYVLFGRQGFHKGALLMLDYVDRIPKSQEVICCAMNSRELWHGDIAFALRFLRKLNRALINDARFTVIESEEDSYPGSPHFSIFWLVHNLKGNFRGRVYRGGEAPEHFVASIPGYWSGRVEANPQAKDGLESVFSTDSLNVRRDTALCHRYISQCAPPSQYGFLSAPEGNSEYSRRWPARPHPQLSTTGFSCISRIPLFGIMTINEFQQIGGVGIDVSVPGYLFSRSEHLPCNSRYLIFCAEDIHEALMGSGSVSVPLSSLLCRELRVPKELVRNMVQRMLSAISHGTNVQIALVPRKAFERFEMELVTWQGILAVGWLQDGSESLLDTEPVVIASFDHAVDYAWHKLSKRWKDQKRVVRTLSGWLNQGEVFTDAHDEPTADDWFPYQQL